MSWKDKIEKELSITTGDGKVYKPLWLNASKKLEWHTSEFEFVEKDGTRVDRRKLKGRRFPLEIYFQGEENIETAAAFEISANDTSSPWIVDHPFYELITVEPTSLNFDNSVMNITKITGILVETITDDLPRTTLQPVDAIRIQKINLDASFEASIKSTPTPGDVAQTKKNLKKNFNLSVPVIKIPEQFEQYNNAFNQANSFVNTATASPLLAIRYTMNAISMPAQFTSNVKERVSLLSDQFDSLRLSVSSLVKPSSKEFFTAQAGTMLSSMCLAASLPLEADYLYGTKVLEIMDQISDNYRLLQDDLDTLQTTNGGSPDSFVPDPDSLNALNQLINLTVSSLYEIALGAKKERVIYAESDTNLILLTHRFYGLDDEDKNLQELQENNNFSFDQLLQIKKGSKIVYYI